MRKFNGWVETDKIGSLVEFEFEVEDDAEQIELEFKTVRADYFDSGYEEKQS